ncbi:hypothetical protein QO010_002179 [Caulobacter ginsengisoli]|uniref:Baseplate assembly protein n=1 Tax=Caulobacter ginsengisoli TaxID=400775 RepID=A0ABU0ITB0_9CAUL|nr:baseplate J/gp47 family protein [Caulobacter ginsengisoli]MDQ0464398.1 hypothetical protein [Caulobacter ginsengisoli]
MTEPLHCPCDDHSPVLPVNPPGLDDIAFRIATWREFRRALLTGNDGETALQDWRPGGEGDLAVMMVEWWAYLADILTFYNERIANQAYLRTADLPPSVRRLIALLGYRPRPAIAAHGTLAALVEPGREVKLPKGLQFQNKPGPGEDVQTFELDEDVVASSPTAVPARPVGDLLAPETDVLYLAGEHTDLDNGEILLLRRRGWIGHLLQVYRATVVVRPDRTKVTRVEVSFYDTPPTGLRAADYRLLRSRQTSSLWSACGTGLPPETGQTLTQDLHLPSRIPPLAHGEPVLLVCNAAAPVLGTVDDIYESSWYANGDGGDPGKPPVPPILPVLVGHTLIRLKERVITQEVRNNFRKVTVTYGWADVGRLIEQPNDLWDGKDGHLEAVAPARFRAGTALPALLEGASGGGLAVTLESSGDGAAIAGGLPTPPHSLTTPLKAHYNLLPVSRGKSVRNEVVGSGDARQAGQSFNLAKSPVTWLAKGVGWVSTIALRVDGRPWKEVASFYGQAPDAKVFVTHENEDGTTKVLFGDGVNGARLPTGINNIVADYRIGAGVKAPPAGRLTILANPVPGLIAVRNPVAVGGGADADPPDQIRRYAPRSVLTFGRAVSVLDYEAIAAQAPGVTRARAAWAWDEASQRTAVTVYVGNDAAAVTSATDSLKGACGRTLPTVVPARPLRTRLRLKLQVEVGMDAAAIAGAVRMALTRDGALFSPQGLRIGQPVFESAIIAAILAVDGTVAVLESNLGTQSGVNMPWNEDGLPVHPIGEDGWFDLDPRDIAIDTSVGENAHG